MRSGGTPARRLGASSRPSGRVGKQRRAMSGAGKAGNDKVDTEDLGRLNQEMQEYDEKRESVIKRARDIVKSAKSAIYCLHRGDKAKARSLMEQAEAVAWELHEWYIKANPSLRVGIYSGGLEELTEARIFESFLEDGSIPASINFPLIDREEYLGGILDFTGELNRYAVMQATHRNTREVEKCRDVVDALMGQLLQFDFRNGNLRKKFDALKYTLKKMENTTYELSLHGHRVEDEDQLAGQPEQQYYDDEYDT